ncbi:HAMP domain-containing histidine kinase [Bradyrhizobium sp. AUGA SZCCT0169]|jgi:signal transduction histidine kinase|uniref:sensor histidine kinase n=1 Tax=Bradyrhizobium sp. AUGA SZCCT0169 TaxID=2807663 RepID=UPI001BA602B4|nr:HAMP domain-containing sensor histidine kinase [Bradyrhizobium sp. AUGA SZCCT0169]MBR1249718.1 HAMP domain-containing histidine kinase [Bradyrhizobium sp. AUGA SZCCT0169]
MTPRSAAGGGSKKPQSRTAKPRKRIIAPKVARASRSAKTDAENPAQTEVERLALELQQARERQAATSEVLSLIADAPTDLAPVFDRIVRNAARLCQSVLSAVYRRDGDHVHLVAHDQFSPASVAAVRKAYPAPLTSKNLISVAIRERRVVHEPDVLVSGGYSELQKTSGYRSILIVPMLRDEVAIGAIAVMRLEPQLFPKAQVELLKTFAGQAVIAIENTRLFTEVQERTRQLSQSLDDLRAAQGSLVQTEKLAALGRLVAGVAHEINTPVGTSLTVASALINKTKRFEADVAKGDVRRSTLSEFIAASREAASQIMFNLGNAVELIQSFKQVAADRNVSDRRRFDLGEVTEQVVGGLRFGLRGQNLTVAVECEPDLVMNSYPGPYGQVLTNLVLNSAAHAFPDGGGGSVHIAAQASGKGNVEVLFSDDGCGMSPEVKRQVFDPFFTTRRDQGNTGLGLHIVHNIVTNRLGGRIHLETKPGMGTKIQIIMPREAPREAAAE